MKKVFLAALLLTGCGQTNIKPTLDYVYCVTPEQYAELVKAEPAKVGGTLTGDARKDVKIIGESNVLLRNWGEGLLQVIGSCTK